MTSSPTPKIKISDLSRSVNVGFVGPSKKVRDVNGIPFLMGKNIGPGFLKLHDLDRVTADFHASQKKSMLKPGDVVVVRIGNSGQAAKIPESLGEANCAGLVIIKGLKDVDADYLVHYLNSPTGRNYSLGKAKGSTRATLNTKSVAQTPVPVPSLDVQRRLSRRLNDFSQKAALLADVQAKSVELFSEFKSKRLNQLFTEQDQFELVNLEASCSLITKGTTPTSVGFSFVDLGVNFVKIESIDEDGAFLPEKFAHIDIETYNALKRSQLQKGDVLVTIAGALGRAAIVTEDILPANTNQAVSLVRFKRDSRIRPDYFLALLKSGYFKGQFEVLASGAAQQNLSLSQLRRLLVPAPTERVQTDFIQGVDSIEKIHTALKDVVHLQSAELSRLQSSFLSSVFERETLNV